MNRIFFKIKPWIMPGVFLVAVAAGIYFTFNLFNGADKGVNRAGKIPVPISIVDIPAYTRVARNHLDVIYLDPKHLSDDVYRNYKEVLGRVLSGDKRNGYVFQEKDFLPKGTSEGVSGAIPEGKRAFTIETDNVQGLYGLKLGDRFDLMGVFRIENQGSKKSLVNQTSSSLIGGLTQPTILVQNGQILVPMRTRIVTYNQSSLTQGQMTRQKPVRETVIAASPSEVEALAQAISMKAELYVVPRSGRAGNPDQGQNDASSNTGSFYGGVGIVETMKGDSRAREIVPKIEGGGS